MQTLTNTQKPEIVENTLRKHFTLVDDPGDYPSNAGEAASKPKLCLSEVSGTIVLFYNIEFIEYIEGEHWTHLDIQEFAEETAYAELHAAKDSDLDLNDNLTSPSELYKTVGFKLIQLTIVPGTGMLVHLGAFAY